MVQLYFAITLLFFAKFSYFELNIITGNISTLQKIFVQSIVASAVDGFLVCASLCLARCTCDNLKDITECCLQCLGQEI